MHDFLHTYKKYLRTIQFQLAEGMNTFQTLASFVEKSHRNSTCIKYNNSFSKIECVFFFFLAGNYFCILNRNIFLYQNRCIHNYSKENRPCISNVLQFLGYLTSNQFLVTKFIFSNLQLFFQLFLAGLTKNICHCPTSEVSSIQN